MAKMAASGSFRLCAVHILSYPMPSPMPLLPPPPTDESARWGLKHAFHAHVCRLPFRSVTSVRTLYHAYLTYPSRSTCNVFSGATRCECRCRVSRSRLCAASAGSSAQLALLGLVSTARYRPLLSRLPGTRTLMYKPGGRQARGCSVPAGDLSDSSVCLAGDGRGIWVRGLAVEKEWKSPEGRSSNSPVGLFPHGARGGELPLYLSR
ncbi:hypothetical protein F4780DRAFT_532701 [Xylariomycetidae sp. FL0641]|nr:hypothetical protein F4780DRAFT_200194 [Xylariomycetidae sp. FL0641]KAI0018254.1 hypothetical protein F4780DRAFT_532701 [Xylariomycetidae sp. FL0641]